MKPKYHAFAHMVYDLDNLENPKYFHCYGHEYYMGVIAAITKGCHRKVFTTRAMQRLVWNIIMDFKNMESLERNKKAWHNFNR